MPTHADVLAADARNRALRSFLTGLGVDVPVRGMDQPATVATST